MKAYFEKRDDQIFITRTDGFSFPLHLHPHLELIIIHSGSIRITVCNQSKMITEGSLAVIFPNQVHCYDNPSPNSRITMVIIDLSYSRGYMDMLLQHHPTNSFVEKERVHENIPYAIDQILQEYESTGKHEIYYPLVQLILARVLHEISLHSNHCADHQQMTRQIADYVNEHYHEHITLGTMAYALGMCKYRLSRLFSEKFRQSFPAYLSSIRLSYARSLLAESHHTITEISEESGFGSLRTFFRVFHTEHKMTPLEFRKNYKSEKTGSV